MTHGNDQPRNGAIRPMWWRDGRLHLLDQRLLPARMETLVCTTALEVSDAIRDMVVRGAPAIGITAAYGVVLAARARYHEAPNSWKAAIREDIAILGASRPTAVNLAWALERMSSLFPSLDGNPETALLDEAARIHEEDIAANREMGRLGSALITDPCAVITHCNAGALATGGYGTALGVIRAAFAAGKIREVYADETRPWLQGSRLTAWELMQGSIPVRLLADSAAAVAMRRSADRGAAPDTGAGAMERIDWVIVGADRIAANGDVANKIGTYSLAIHARHHGVRFMVVAPTATIDGNIPDGAAIPIEMRSEEEVLAFAGTPVAPPGAAAWNPVFDVTPAALVDALVTEKGVVERPDREKMMALLG
uniref:Methylthioribose-1-phosphate isomerase n=1 Tax=Candidatus Kentrum sp. DK TaxID=2126562 RepID=A0A450SB18_9GAMM|nr:MAG: methylthioribose-1-phosphate isomerase [Candidatus Kentron sp. DK]